MPQVPSHIKKAGDPNRLAFTLGYPPFVAVSVGDKYLLTFDTTRVNEDLGLTFPEDYGQIAGYQWLPNLVLLVGLTNGYIVTVDFGALIKLQQSHKLPDRVSAMGTTKVFNEYLQDLSAFYTSATGQRVACCGDTMVKIVHRTGVELEVHLEVALDRQATIGEYLDKVRSRCILPLRRVAYSLLGHATLTLARVYHVRTGRLGRQCKGVCLLLDGRLSVCARIAGLIHSGVGRSNGSRLSTIICTCFACNESHVFPYTGSGRRPWAHSMPQCFVARICLSIVAFVVAFTPASVFCVILVRQAF